LQVFWFDDHRTEASPKLGLKVWCSWMTRRGPDRLRPKVCLDNGTIANGELRFKRIPSLRSHLPQQQRHLRVRPPSGHNSILRAISTAEIAPEKIFRLDVKKPANSAYAGHP